MNSSAFPFALENVRPYTQDDYSLLVSWWAQYDEWKNSPVPEGILPPYGAIVELAEQPVCAGFLYETKGNGCAWLEWIVADPSADKKLRAYSLDLLIDHMTQRAEQEGYQFLFMSVKHPKLMERLVSKGFMQGDSGMTNMIKKVF